MKDNSDMNDKYALVTGAAKGIGKSCVLHLAKMGINVAINYRSSEKEASLLLKEVESIGVKGLIVKADVSDLNEVKNMAKTVLQKFPRIDILVNNAGIGIFNKIENISLDEWDAQLNTNLRGAFLMTKMVVGEMTKNNKGKIKSLSYVISFQF